MQGWGEAEWCRDRELSRDAWKRLGWECKDGGPGSGCIDRGVGK